MGGRGAKSMSSKTGATVGEQILTKTENLLNEWINQEGSPSINARRNLMNMRAYAKARIGNAVKAEVKTGKKNIGQKEYDAYVKTAQIGDAVYDHFESGKSKNSFNRFRKRYGL